MPHESIPTTPRWWWTVLHVPSFETRLVTTPVESFAPASGHTVRYRRVVGELWTSAQRQSCAIHEISYRACFKPEVPRYFIERFSREGDVIYDPFMGRGTTVLESVLLKRRGIGNDINPLSVILTQGRLPIPDKDSLEARLRAIPLRKNRKAEIDLSMFYHRHTEGELVSLKRYLQLRNERGEEDAIDRWIRMVATNRLTGHSPGFFSVYTLPPNLATSPSDQRRINRVRRQKPAYRDVRALIMRKSMRILRRLTEHETNILSEASTGFRLLTRDARSTPEIGDESVQLTVTSPPFLDIVQYAKDNWLRCWFNGIPRMEMQKSVSMIRDLREWSNAMLDVLKELYRITKPGGHVAFEVGEVRKQSIHLDEIIAPVGETAGFRCEKILVNQQNFTKTSNIWGISNNRHGTNSNRIVLFSKR